MKKENLIKTVAEVRKASNKRNFIQTFDLVFSLKNLDLKKPDQQVDFFAHIVHKRKKPMKICALVGPELQQKAKEVFPTVIIIDDFEKYGKDKKLLKKLASEHDFFVAHAAVMPKVAQYFGRVLGPKNKMPNPKSGAVITPATNLVQLNDILQKTARILVKTQLMAQANIGSEDMTDSEIADNLQSLYNQVIHHLPNEVHNLRFVALKLTMGKPIKIDKDGNPIKPEVVKVEETK